MKLRHKEKSHIAFSSKFNTSSLSEIIVHFQEGDADSSLLSEWDIWLEEKQEWKDLLQSFEDRDIIPDNYNSWFAEPKKKEDKERGYFI